MIEHLSVNGIIPGNQHGFLSKKSTVTNLIECLDNWTKCFDMGLQTDVVYLDYSKCFDSVVHSKLLYKLANLYGIVDSAYNWIENFLANRYQYVKVGSALSRGQTVLSGVPQGTVLGPLLFLCFSADINSIVSHVHVSMYADDTKVYKPIHSEADCVLLQDDLNRIHEWASNWQLKLNSDKTKHLRIGRNRYNFIYRLNGEDIETVDTVCDIGGFCAI